TSVLIYQCPPAPRALPSFPTRRSSDLLGQRDARRARTDAAKKRRAVDHSRSGAGKAGTSAPCEPPSSLRLMCAPAESGRRRRRRSEEHTSELQSRSDLVCRLLLEKKKT